MGTKRTLDTQTVLQAAAELAQEKGLENITLFEVAGKLGVKPPSLYNHVNGLKALSTGIAKYTMEKLEAAGMRGYVGKVSMDRNAPETLCECDAERAARDCENWLIESQKRFTAIRPVITPRFIPSCTDTLMERLAALAKTYDVPVQSHLSENRSEIEWVKQLCPRAKGYADAYDRIGMLGPRTVMAHVVYPEDEEIALLRERGVAFCGPDKGRVACGDDGIGRLVAPEAVFEAAETLLKR